MIDQLSVFLETRFSPYLSGFRKKHNCENVLLRFIEQCKSSLDHNETYGAILTDLSKAFDCLPHKLLIAKMSAYGVDKSACKLMASYFMERQQRIKIGNDRSDWQVISKGAAQGSLIGPLAFNMHLNDLIIRIMSLSDVFNYADDTTVCCRGSDYNEVSNKLQTVVEIMINWFNNNHMKVNTDKFQMIVFEKEYHEHKITIGRNEITNQKSVKLLGLNVDNNLRFSDHILELCKKAGRKVNVLARLSTQLDQNSKCALFYSYIISQFEYCSFILNLCHVKDLRKIEKVQERALRYIYRDFTSNYSMLRSKADRPTMYVHSLRSMLAHVYKIINHITPCYLNDMYILKDNVYNTRGDLRLSLPSYKTMRHGKNSVSYKGANLWNALSNTRNSLSLNQFKRNVSQWTPTCNCQNCVLCNINV